MDELLNIIVRQNKKRSPLPTFETNEATVVLVRDNSTGVQREKVYWKKEGKEVKK